MKKLCTLIITAFVVTLGNSPVHAADGKESVKSILSGIKVSADLELFYETSDNVGGAEDDDKFKTEQLYLKFDKDSKDGYAARLKLDAADIIGKDGKYVTHKIVEEANFTIKDVGGMPLAIVFGKDEMPYGLDYDKYLNDPLAHNFEIDKVFGVHSILKIEDFGNLAAAIYEHRNGSARNELINNVTARLTIDKLIKGLKMELSCANEEYYKSGSTTVDDEIKYSAGLVYKFLDGANVNLEYNGFQNRKGTADYNPGLITVGLEYKIDEIKVYGRYEKILADAGVTEVEEDYFMLGLGYTLTKNYTISLEYANFNSSNYKDASDLKVADGSLNDSVRVGIRAKF